MGSVGWDNNSSYYQVKKKFKNVIHIANLLFIEVVEILTSNSFDLFLEVVLSCFSHAADSLQPYGQ